MRKLLSNIFLSFILCLIHVTGCSQKPLTRGDEIQDLPIKKVLGPGDNLTSIEKLNSKITIIDFFGTWCAPCLRALPRLEAIKQKFKGDVSVVLISNETEEQLTKFIKRRKDFSFPIIWDEDNKWTNYFQPPSLPYTVVLKGNNIVDITTAETLTDDAIQKWLSEGGLAKTKKTKETETMTLVPNRKSNNAVVELSQRFIYAAKTGDDISGLLSELERMDYATLKNVLNNDNAKKAFWINIYNGYTQASLQSNPERYKNRNAFFGKKSIKVGGKWLSLDDIEHGILRRSKIKWSLGYMNKLFPGREEKDLRVNKEDYRIHFALNCGAKSCPPIAFYNDATIDKQLDVASKAYLKSEVNYDSVKNVLYLPKIMSWFRADFGGEDGMKSILKKEGIIPKDANPKIKFNEYNWALTLNNYSNQN
jgi:thiol-disulfide isomerase/thioredoxin